VELTLKDKFTRDGYVTFDAQIEEQWLDAAREITEAAFDPDKRMYDLVHIYNSVKQIALWPSIISAIEEVHDFSMQPWQTMNFKYGTEQPAHSDTIHFNTVPAGRMCGVWVALEDVKEDQGPLFYYPGSHRLPEYVMSDVGTVPPPIEARKPCEAYEAYMESVIARENLEAEVFTCSKGQVFIWASNFLHGGSKVTREGATRYSQVTHYYAPNCTYYRPMYSRPGALSIKEDIRWIEW
jgi:ectoine hydroxylase-related dioxygenase (phytanoyl-CoA dioxygenase family)